MTFTKGDFDNLRVVLRKHLEKRLDERCEGHLILNLIDDVQTAAAERATELSAIPATPMPRRNELLPHAILHLVAAGSQLCKDKPDFVLTPAVAAVLREYLESHQEET